MASCFRRLLKLSHIVCFFSSTTTLYCKVAILDFCLLLLIPVVLDNGTNLVFRTNFDKNWHIGSCNQRDPARIGVFSLKWPKNQYRLDKSFVYEKVYSSQNVFFHLHYKKTNAQLFQK